LSRLFQPASFQTSIDSRPERPDSGGKAAQHGATRKPSRLTVVTAGALLLAVGAATTVVALWPGAQLTASATPAPHTRPITGTVSVASSGPIHPTVIRITASSGQDDQVRAIEAWLTSHALWQRQPVTMAVTLSLPSTPAPPKPATVAPPAAPVQQVAPAAAVTGPAASGSPQQIALAMLASYGWSSSQFACLDPLWAHESGWNVYASNPGSGAYGIPQALPGAKMASAGPDWQSNATTQIRWGLSYIQATYGSPCAAWAHEEAAGWY
jgi:hypothetical protein